VCARLGKEANLAGVGHGRIGVEADPGFWQVEAHAVGPDEVEIRLARHRRDLFLELDAQFLARLREARGEEAGAVCFVRDEVLEHVRRNLAGHGHQRVVDGLGHIGHGPEVLDAERFDAGDFLLIQLDGVQPPALFLEGLVVLEPHVVGPLIADDGDDFRVEHAVEPVTGDCHGTPTGVNGPGAGTPGRGISRKAG
jgi:hypothetical protein